LNEPGKRAARGSLQSFAAHALALPTGLLAASFLTRQLGPELYGEFSVSVSVVLWIQLSLNSMFGFTTVKFIAEKAGSARESLESWLVRARFLVSAVVAVFLVVTAPLLADLLNAPEITGYLRLLALDIPIFALSHAHRSILTGREAFAPQAMATAGRHLGRLALVLILVGLGLSVTGAILASIGASMVELVIARRAARPKLLGRLGWTAPRLLHYALPLLAYGVGIRLFGRLDLLVLQALGGSTIAGLYAAAQNLTVFLIPMLLAAPLSPVLLATLTRLLAEGDHQSARETAWQGLRFILLMTPFAALTAGIATEVVSLLYGDAFQGAGDVVAILAFAGVAMALIFVGVSVLTAAGKPRLGLVLTAPLVPLALAGHLLIVPHQGSTGAAMVTTSLAWVCALATWWLVARQMSFRPQPLAALRILVTTLVAFLVAWLWETSGIGLILEVLGTTAAIVGAFVLMGEVTSADLVFLKSLFRIESRSIGPRADRR
jgi:O-antigen/teichoic acid export membrane protein